MNPVLKGVAPVGRPLLGPELPALCLLLRGFHPGRVANAKDRAARAAPADGHKQIARFGMHDRRRRSKAVVPAGTQEDFTLAPVCDPVLLQPHEVNLPEGPVTQEEAAAVLLGKLAVPIADTAGRRAAA